MLTAVLNEMFMTFVRLHNKTLDYTVTGPSLPPLKSLSIRHSCYDTYTVTGCEGPTEGGLGTGCGSLGSITLRISY
jgi:hypothetical protein